MNDPERWVAVPGVPGYQVSDLGRVRSLDRDIVKRYSYGLVDARLRGRIIQPGNTGNTGRSVHLTAALCVNGAERKFYIHRLVLEAFVGPCPDGMECCHNNGKSDDNRLVNLRWDTPTANSYDTVRHGAHWQTKKTTCPRGHRLVEPNLVAARLRQGGRKCLSCTRAANRRRRFALNPDRSEFDFDAVAGQIYRQLIPEAGDAA